LICNSQGCPVAVEVFPGNTNDASTVKAQIEKVRNRFGLDCVVWVGDKGMLTSLLFEEEPEELSLDESRVLKYQANSKTKRKSRTKRNELNEPVHSFRTLLSDLGTICLNTIEVIAVGQSVVFEKITELTDLQQKAIDLLEVSCFCTHVNS
jgi:hypothetical protein